MHEDDQKSQASRVVDPIMDQGVWTVPMAVKLKESGLVDSG